MAKENREFWFSRDFLPAFDRIVIQPHIDGRALFIQVPIHPFIQSFIHPFIHLSNSFTALADNSLTSKDKELSLLSV